MPDNTNLSILYGQGVLHSGLGNFEVKGDLNIGVSKNCLSDLFLTDPRHDKARIEQAKGGLLRDAYCWILTNNDFLRWRSDPSGLLWVRGDPGKGKTMLLCGIINELENQEQASNTTHLLSFFFCQADDPRLNNATAVLRGLIYFLISQRPSLISHVEEVYSHTGKVLFEGVNAWVALRKIFENILRDPNLPDTTVVIDALDECETDLALLIDLITVSSRVKWIVSSRNRLDIEERLYNGTQPIRSLWLELCLELNESSISESVRRYIQHEVDRLSKLKNYNDELRDVVQDYLASHAHGTFLWVALVCQALADPEVRPWHTLDKLREFPPGLDSLYDRMIDQITQSYDAEPCKQILGVMSIIYRPLSLKELALLVGSPEDLEGIIRLCGSFLVLRQGTVSFLHQSAKDYLQRNTASKISRSNTRNEHQTICKMMLRLMSQNLRRDIYNLNDWGIPPSEITPPEPDPLAAMRYSCIYWIDHLAECQPSEQTQYHRLQGSRMVHRFLRKHYLHWLEALSIFESLPQGVLALSKLKGLTPGETTELGRLAQDAHRFVQHNISAIEKSPLQVYASALLFTPRKSLIRNLFEDEKPPWLALGPDINTIRDQWSTYVATFPCIGNYCKLLVFSPDGSRLALDSSEFTIAIWDIDTGARLLTLRGHENNVTSAAFSPDGTQLVSGSDDESAKIWDLATGACLSTLIGHEGPVGSVAFSPNGKFLGSSSGWDPKESAAKLWDVTTGACLATLLVDTVLSLDFLPNGDLLVSGLIASGAKICDVATGACLFTLEGGSIDSVTFSPDRSQMALVSIEDTRENTRENTREETISVWDVATGARLATLGRHRVYSVAFLPHEGQIVSQSDTKILVWDIKTSACLETFQGPRFRSMAFSPSGRLAAISYNGTVKVWERLEEIVNLSLADYMMELSLADFIKDHSYFVTDIAFSLDGSLVASVSFDSTAKIWNVKTGKCLESLSVRSGTCSVAFSPDGSHLITNTGNIPLPASLHTNPFHAPSSRRPTMLHQGMKPRMEWIICNGQKLLWLPLNYMPSCLATYAQTIAVGCRSGLVWILNLSFPVYSIGEDRQQSSGGSALETEIEMEIEEIDSEPEVHVDMLTDLGYDSDTFSICSI